MDISELEKYEEIVDVSFDHEGSHLASTHQLQGGASSGWNTALLLKGSDSDEKLIKALEQVEVTLSFEEFLIRFFDMWSDDAEFLTKLLGFETEQEYKRRLDSNGIKHPDRMGTEESWEEYQKRNLEAKADKVKILKDLSEGVDIELSTDDKIDLLEFQSEIEKAFEFFGGYESTLEKFKKDSVGISSESINDLSEDGKELTKAEGKSGGSKTSSKTNHVNKSNKKEVPLMVDKKKDEVVEVVKSEAEIALEKMASEKATLEKALADQSAKIEALEKAEMKRAMDGAVKLVKSYGFIEDEKVEEVAGFMVKSAEAPLIAELLKQAKDAIEAAQAETAEIKKEFGETEHGVDGVADEAVVAPQSRLDKSLAEFQEVLKEMA